MKTLVVLQFVDPRNQIHSGVNYKSPLKFPIQLLILTSKQIKKKWHIRFEFIQLIKNIHHSFFFLPNILQLMRCCSSSYLEKLLICILTDKNATKHFHYITKSLYHSLCGLHWPLTFKNFWSFLIQLKENIFQTCLYKPKV